MKKLGTLLWGMFVLLSGMVYGNNKEPRSEQPIRVACVGNSITSGIGCSSEAAAWPAQVNKLLGSRYAVTNCGVSGTTMFKRSNFPYWITSQFKRAKNLNPQILIIALGNNDSSARRWNVLKGEFKSDYLDMIKEFRRGGKDPIIYLCIPAPLFGPSKAAQDAVVVNELAPIIREIAHETGAYVIDLHQPLVNAGKYFPDDVHPNDSGALLIARVIYDNISKAQIINPHLSVKKGEAYNKTVAAVEEGGRVSFAPTPKNGIWNWSGPDGFHSDNRVVSLENVKKGGVYTAVHTDKEGRRSVLNFLVSIKGRKAGFITANIRNKDGELLNTNTVTTNPGTTLTLIPQIEAATGTWTWSGPNNFFACTREISLNTLLPKQSGKYVATFTDNDGNQSWRDFFVTVEGELFCPDVVSYINMNGKWESTCEMEVKEGQSVTFGPQPLNGQWTWEGPDGFTSNRREVTVKNFNSRKAGEYIGIFTNAAGCKVELIITLRLKQ